MKKMTLVLHRACPGIIIMSGDSKSVDALLDPYTFQQIEGTPLEDTGRKVEKVIKISDYSLLGVGGFEDVGDKIKLEMLSRSKQRDTFRDSVRIFNQIVDELRGEGSEISNYLNSKNTLSCVISGFCADGKIGVSDFESGKDTYADELILTHTQETKTILAPLLEFGDMIDDLFDMKNKIVTEESLIKKMMQIHATIAHITPQRVSNDCYIHILRAPEASGCVPSYQKKVMDTTKIQKKLPPIDKLKKQLGLQGCA
jgi:hypothetical protein